MSDAPLGRLLDGRYRVDAALARGGMATVYRALDTRLDRIVALKVMHPELTVDDEFVASFIGEARSAARLSHPNVVGVFDQGQDDGVVFLAMEYVEGSTLRHVLRERGPLTPAQALAMLEPVLSALSAAHEAGIVHRDIKPENVLVGENGRIKVADFGLARALADSGTGNRGVLLGTVNYISPEQAQGAPATPRSDVYSAGVMLYELLTGVPPHGGATDSDVVRSHIERDVPPPSAVVPAIAPAVDGLVQRATAREPQARFADAAAFGEAVRTTMTAIGAPVPGLEERESAGVTVTEALALGNLEPADGSGAGHTTVIPAPTAAPAAPPGPARRPSAPPARHGRRGGASRRRSRRRHGRAGPILLVLALVLAAAVIAGAWWLGEGRYTSVPPLVGLTYEQAELKAEEAGLRVRRSGTEHSEAVEEGNVVRTVPATADRILRGRYVGLVISEGAERFEVPDLQGLTEQQAVEELEELNLVADVEKEYHDTVEEGMVIGQGVDPGEQLRADEQVPVYVSQGREPIELVDYTGQRADLAQRQLTDAGFEVVVEEQPAGGVRPGFVISQEPSSGEAYRGDQVTLYVASEDARIPVPDVVGMQVDEAQRLLAEAGFTNIRVDGRLLFWRDTVAEQRPRAGEEIKPDQRIELRTR